jgi:hypothetical protein
MTVISQVAQLLRVSVARLCSCCRIAILYINSEARPFGRASPIKEKEGFFGYAEKELPQPQVLFACGLLNVKPRAFRPS